MYINIILGRCTDLDDGKQDSEDDGCENYAKHKDKCGRYDDDDFNAHTMCCTCRENDDSVEGNSKSKHDI